MATTIYACLLQADLPEASRQADRQTEEHEASRMKTMCVNKLKKQINREENTIRDNTDQIDSEKFCFFIKIHRVEQATAATATATAVLIFFVIFVSKYEQHSCYQAPWCFLVLPAMFLLFANDLLCLSSWTWGQLAVACNVGSVQDECSFFSSLVCVACWHLSGGIK